MAASISIEDEQGTCVGSTHPHNGYFAGEFTGGTAASAGAPPPSRTPPLDHALTGQRLASAWRFAS